jgi:hypothetical protein
MARAILFGFALALVLSQVSYAVPTIAYDSAPSLSGQGHTGGLGHDFIVNSPIVVTRLGVYDQGGDGIGGGVTITANLWSRNTNGTPAAFGDDTGIAILASQTFTNADPGTLVAGSAYRFKDLATPLILQPGNYTMAAHGFGAAANNQNANGGLAGFGVTNDGGGLISFVGVSRFNGDPTGAVFPTGPDGGPAARYGAGSFVFFSITEMPEPSSWIAFLGVLAWARWFAASEC